MVAFYQKNRCKSYIKRGKVFFSGRKQAGHIYTYRDNIFHMSGSCFQATSDRYAFRVFLANVQAYVSHSVRYTSPKYFNVRASNTGHWLPCKCSHYIPCRSFSSDDLGKKNNRRESVWTRPFCAFVAALRVCLGASRRSRGRMRHVVLQNRSRIFPGVPLG